MLLLYIINNLTSLDCGDIQYLHVHSAYRSLVYICPSTRESFSGINVDMSLWNGKTKWRFQSCMLMINQCGCMFLTRLAYYFSDHANFNCQIKVNVNLFAVHVFLRLLLGFAVLFVSFFEWEDCPLVGHLNQIINLVCIRFCWQIIVQTTGRNCNRVYVLSKYEVLDLLAITAANILVFRKQPLATFMQVKFRTLIASLFLPQRAGSHICLDRASSRQSYFVASNSMKMGIHFMPLWTLFCCVKLNNITANSLYLCAMVRLHCQTWQLHVVFS